MKKTLLLLLLPLFTLQAQNYIAWSTKKLNYENFKQKPLQTKNPQGVLDSRLGWKIAEENGKISEAYVYNRMNEDNSWISMKHEDILKNMQLQFDLSELYARKIRKDFDILKNNKVNQKDAYKKKFDSHHKNFQKRLNSMSNVAVNQPSFYKILNNQIQDSLKLYKLHESKN